MFKRCIIIISLFILFCCTLPERIDRDEDDNNDDNYKNIKTFERFVARDRVNWVFMVYMDGDNNLEGNLFDDLNEMELGLYNLQNNSQYDFSQIKIVAFYDRISGYTAIDGDWTNTRFYEVVPDNDPGKIKSILVANYQEMDMGAHETLTLFLNKVLGYYPANNYFLDIENHGDGVNDNNTTYVALKSADDTRGAVSDDTNDGYMYLGEIKEALQNTEGNYFYNNKLAGIGFDACLMGMFEVAYEFKDYADYFVGSMALETSNGWDYSRIFRDLQAGAIGALDFSAKIVDEYYNQHSLISNQTLSASDLTKIEDLKISINNLAAAIYYEDIKTGIEAVRDDTVNFYYNYYSLFYPYYDLYDFCSRVGILYINLKDEADDVINKLNDVIVKAYAGTGFGGYHDAGARGLSIFFSRGDMLYNDRSHYAYHWFYTSGDTKTMYDETYQYGHIDFCETNGNGIVNTWKELLEAWYDPGNLLTPAESW